MKKLIPLTLLLVGLFLLGCKKTPPLPDTSTASKLIQDLIIENGNMPGGNMIDIHRFEIKNTEPGSQLNTAIIDFLIDFTRYPTSGLDPERYHEDPTRQTENHQAVLVLEKDKWTVREISLN